MIIRLIQNKNKRSLSFIILSVAALLIPCLLAAFRDVTIGTDVQVYAKPLFELALNVDSFSEYQNASWWSVWRYRSPSDYEIGFSFLVWFVTSLTSSFPVLLLLIQSLAVVPIYLGLLRMRDRNKDLPVWLGMAIYYLMYYNTTLNAMRQWIAIGWLLYSFTYLFTRDYIQYLIGTLFATLFHTSALLGIVILAIFIFITNSAKPAKRVITVAATSIALLMLCPLISYLMELIGLEKYAVYVGAVQILPKPMVLRFPLICLVAYYLKNNGGTKLPYFFLGMICLDIACSQLASANIQSARIGYYFGSIFIYYAPLALLSVKQNRQRYTLTGLIILYSLTLWVYYYAIAGYSETIPYYLNQSIL